MQRESEVDNARDIDQPAHLRVASILREQILSEKVRPGERLIEREICESTGFSRPAVREALRLLESERLVTSHRGKGTRVAVISWAEARDIYQVRAVLESLACRLFTTNASAEQRAALRSSVREIERSTNSVVRFKQAKEAFYAALLDGADNDALSQMISTLNLRVRFLRSASLSVRGRLPQSLEEIKVIVAAIEAGDADAAASAALAHVHQAAEMAREALLDQTLVSV
jgi:GntR family transcriptional regulator, trigonelline degradation regulator